MSLFSLDSLKEAYNKMVGTADSVVKPLNVAAPSLATTGGATKTFGTAPEQKGYTMTGGRRTHRNRKHKKTHKRNRKH